MFKPFRAPIARPDQVSGRFWICAWIALTLAKLPKVEVQHAIYYQARLGLDQDRCEHCGVYEHAAFQKKMQCPLCAIIVVPSNCPRLGFGLDQGSECFPDRGLLTMPALPYPRRVDMLCHMVCICVGQEPSYEGGGHGGENEASRTSQSAACNAREGCVMISCTRLADWPNRVYVSCDEEEDGYSAAAADGQTEKW
jgi:hypothetical protein